MHSRNETGVQCDLIHGMIARGIVYKTAQGSGRVWPMASFNIVKVVGDFEVFVKGCCVTHLLLRAKIRAHCHYGI